MRRQAAILWGRQLSQRALAASETYCEASRHIVGPGSASRRPAGVNRRIGRPACACDGRQPYCGHGNSLNVHWPLQRHIVRLPGILWGPDLHHGGLPGSTDALEDPPQMRMRRQAAILWGRQLSQRALAASETYCEASRHIVGPGSASRRPAGVNRRIGRPACACDGRQPYCGDGNSLNVHWPLQRHIVRLPGILWVPDLHHGGLPGSTDALEVVIDRNSFLPNRNLPNRNSKNYRNYRTEPNRNSEQG